MTDFDEAITFHEREQRRMERAMNRSWSGKTRDAYAEAAYAHQAALIHLRRCCVSAGGTCETAGEP